MTGLQKEIKTRMDGKKRQMNDLISYAGISRLLKISYPTAKRKIENNSFTVSEAIYIFNFLFNSKEKFEAFEYLFTDCIKE